MEKNYILLTFPFLLILILSCSMESALRENVNKEGEHGYDFIESKKEWDKLKVQNGNSYFYVMLEQSFSGFGSETKILVNNGKVIARYYDAFEISEEDGTKTVTYSYSEEVRKDLGKHAEGAPPVNMDELYKSCLSKYLIADPDTNTVYFDTTAEGVMILCGFVPHGCHDDCYSGIRISEFVWM